MAAPSKRVRVYVADDHPLYREALAQVISRRPELELVGEAEDGQQAIDAIAELVPDVAVIDLHMPKAGGLEILSAVRSSGGQTQVMILSASTEREHIYKAIAAGARGYLSKDAGAESICDAVVAVGRGEAVLAPTVQAALADEISERSLAERSLLTDREMQVLGMTAEGLSNRQIGERLHVSPSTIKSHLEKVYEKLGVSDRTQAAVVAMRRGLLD